MTRLVDLRGPGAPTFAPLGGGRFRASGPGGERLSAKQAKSLRRRTQRGTPPAPAEPVVIKRVTPPQTPRVKVDNLYFSDCPHCGRGNDCWEKINTIVECFGCGGQFVPVD